MAGPDSPWPKSIPGLWPLEKLRFSRELHSRHLIHEVQQAVCPQPADRVGPHTHHGTDRSLSTAVSRRVRVAGYRINRFHAVENPHSYQTSRGLPGVAATQRPTFSQPRFALIVHRDGHELFAKMFQAMFVAVGVALLACFIKPIHVDPRFGLGVGALFAAGANSYLVNAEMPDGGEFSLADVINLLGIVTILVTLAESTISLQLFESLDQPALSRRLDRVTFWTILVCFVLSLLLLLWPSGVV